MTNAPAEQLLRNALGHFATGVVIIGTRDETGRPHGFACQSFASLSLAPPMVLFCASHHSRAWAVTSRTRRFAASILSDQQRNVSAVFGTKTDNKFDRIDWHAAPDSGNPVVSGCIAWVDADVEEVHPGGDHDIIAARVVTVSEPKHGAPAPLLFYRGNYSSPAPTTLD